MKKTNKLISVVIILNLIYLIFDVCYFLFLRTDEKISEKVYEFGYESNMMIFGKWILIIIIILLLFRYLKNSNFMLPIIIASILSLIILVLFGYNYLVGNLYRGSFVYKIGLLELVSFLNIISSIRIILKSRNSLR